MLKGAYNKLSHLTVALLVFAAPVVLYGQEATSFKDRASNIQLPSSVISAPEPEPKAAAETKEDADARKEIRSSQGDWRVSVMFSVDDMRRLRKVLTAYESGFLAQEGKPKKTVNSEEDFLSKLLSKAGQDDTSVKTVTLVYPVFYLGSIVYVSQDEWTVWLNGHKIDQRINRVQNPVYVSKISKYEVELLWKPDNMGEVSRYWRNHKKVREKVQKGVKVDVQNASVSFNLRPNQTFESATMSIAEGKVPPSKEVLDASSIGIEESTSETQPLAPVPVVSTETPEKEKTPEKDMISPEPVSKDSQEKVTKESGVPELAPIIPTTPMVITPVKVEPKKTITPADTKLVPQTPTATSNIALPIPKAAPVSYDASEIPGVGEDAAGMRAPTTTIKTIPGLTPVAKPLSQ